MTTNASVIHPLYERMKKILMGATALLPLGVSAQIVPCENDCNFDSFVTLIQNIISFLLLNIAAPLAMVVFAYAGFLMFTARGNEQQISHAKSIFWYVLIGVIVALAAWLIVSVIINVLGAEDTSLIG